MALSKLFLLLNQLWFPRVLPHDLLIMAAHGWLLAYLLRLLRLDLGFRRVLLVHPVEVQLLFLAVFHFEIWAFGVQRMQILLAFRFWRGVALFRLLLANFFVKPRLCKNVIFLVFHREVAWVRHRFFFDFLAGNILIVDRNDRFCCLDMLLYLFPLAFDIRCHRPYAILDSLTRSVCQFFAQTEVIDLFHNHVELASQFLLRLSLVRMQIGFAHHHLARNQSIVRLLRRIFWIWRLIWIDLIC